MKRSYEETVEFLYSQLPVFQREGAAAYKPGLQNIEALCAAIGNPQHDLRCIHIGGTNGKGSSSHSLASVLQAEGYKTGLYTSPHLVDFRERIRINGEMVPKEFITETIHHWIPLIEKLKPSFFEVTVALAFDYFRRQGVDFAVIEVGMGGRLDSTNIIRPLLSLITNIGWDHQKFLGDTLEKIAFEKAGIIKENTPVVISESQPESLPVFVQKATEYHAPLVLASEEWTVQDSGVSEGFRRILATEKKHPDHPLPIRLSLLGAYQVKNLKGILSSIRVLQNLGIEVREESIQIGLSNVQSATGLQGRWQILQHQPLVIADTGHNRDGILEVVKQVESISYRKLWLIWGMVKDKDHEEILELLPRTAAVLATQPHLERALPFKEMNALFLSKGFESQGFETVSHALDFALAQAEKSDLVLVGGSTFTVAEIPFEKFSGLV